jgi:hypothetical protein
MTDIILAFAAAASGGWLVRGGPAASTAGMGCWMVALGPAFGLAESSGYAVGAAAGVGRLAVVAGMPMVALGWWMVGLDPELIRRVRGVFFASLLITAMIDGAGRVAPFAVLASAIGMLGAARCGGAPAAAGLAAAAALAVGQAVRAEQPAWAAISWAVALGLVAFGLRRVDPASV